MMATRIANLILIALVAAAAAACASAPARFYNLDSTATPDGVAATRAAVMVGPVSVPFVTTSKPPLFTETHLACCAETETLAASRARTSKRWSSPVRPNLQMTPQSLAFRCLAGSVFRDKDSLADDTVRCEPVSGGRVQSGASQANFPCYQGKIQGIPRF